MWVLVFRNRQCRRLASFAFALAMLALITTASITLHAQTTKSSISGTVTDTSGSVIPEATVIVHDKGTGYEERVVTDSVGRYLFAELAVGIYDMKAGKQGFETLLRNDIELSVGSHAIVDFAMPVGKAQETMTVHAAVPQVDTTTSSVSNTVEQAQIGNLPLNGRNLTDLINLSPGVSSGIGLGVGSSTSVTYGKQANFSVSGSRPEGQAYMVDNQDVQDFYAHGSGSAALGTTLGVEAISEFQILTSNYSAQFGGNGATVNAVSKQGSNSFHGSAYEYIRNSALDSRNYFDPAKIPEFRQNQFGGSAGGPIKKDKLFFFANYEALIQALGMSEPVTVPDANAHNGIVVVNGVSENIGISPLTAAILSLYPNPGVSTASGTVNLTETAVQPAHENYLLARADYNIDSNDNVTLRWIMDRAHLTEPFAGTYIPPFAPEIATQKNNFATIEWRRVMSTSLINLLRLNVLHTPETDVEQNPIPTGTNALLFFPDRGQVGQVTIGGGVNALGASQFPPVLQEQTKFQEGDDLIWMKGSHSVKVGGYVERVRTTQAPYGYYGGIYAFASITTFLQGTPSSFQGPENGQTNPYRDFREIDFCAYANDEWKIGRKLTLNIGLRYDPTTNANTDKSPLNQLINAPYGTGISSFVPVKNVFASNPSMHNLDPRFGFAYDPFKDHATSLRGGFGIFHDVIQPRVFSSGYYYNPPYTIATISYPTFPNPFAGAFTSGIVSESQGIDYNGMKTPYMMQWNLSVQRQLMASTVLTVAYVGSHGDHLMVQRDINPVTPSTVNGTVVYGVPKGTTKVGIAANPRVNPNFSNLTSSSSIGDSHYNGLQAGMNRRLSHGLQTQVSYTWQRSIDVGSGNYGLEGGTQPMDPYNIHMEYGPSAFNRKQVLKGSGLYELPFHRNILVDGWNVTTIVTAQTGAPFNPTIGFDQAGLLTSNFQRPNRALGHSGPIILGTGNVLHYADATAFSLPAAGTLGDMSRNAFYGPHVVEADISALKDTAVPKVSEQFHVQFRAELFNILNHANFGAPATPVFTQAVDGGATYNTNFGKITSTVTTARQIQFGLKLIF